MHGVDGAIEEVLIVRGGVESLTGFTRRPEFQIIFEKDYVAPWEQCLIDEHGSKDCRGTNEAEAVLYFARLGFYEHVDDDIYSIWAGFQNDITSRDIYRYSISWYWDQD